MLVISMSNRFCFGLNVTSKVKVSFQQGSNIEPLKNFFFLKSVKHQLKLANQSIRVSVLFVLIFISILLLSCNFQNQLIVATVVVFLKFTQVYLKDLQCITKLLHQFRYLVNSFLAGLNNPIHGINFSQPCVTNIKNNVKSKILVQTFCMP